MPWVSRLLPLVGASLATACAVGSLGAPCEIDGDCDEGLACDLHAAGGSCQRGHAHAHAEPESLGCSADERADAYALGLRREGTWAAVEFVAATPAPPRRGDNAWTVRVLDAQDRPRADLDIAVDPFMPDHGHGSTIECDVAPGDEPGTYELAPVNLFMPGLWVVTLDIRADDAPDDAVVFEFCIDP